VGPNLPINKGLSAGAVRNIPETWSAAWFRKFITNHMQRADFRNAIAGPGITITGTEQSSGEISATGGVTQIISGGSGIGVSPAGGTGAVTLTNTGVTSISGTANEIAASSATGAVTLSFPNNLIVPAPTSGVSLTVNGASTAVAMTVSSGLSSSTNGSDLAVTRAGSTANSVVAGPNVTLHDTTNSTQAAMQISGGQLEFWLNDGSWVQALGLTGAPTTGTAHATFTATNKPGANLQSSPVAWLPIVYGGGTVGYIPVYAS
jgi:hypothetical protein